MKNFNRLHDKKTKSVLLTASEKNRFLKQFEFENNKSQITIFLIVAVLLVVTGIVIYFMVSSHNAPVVNNPNLKPIVNHIQQCLDISSVDVLNNFGMHGGVLNFQSRSIIPNFPTSGEGFFLGKSDLQVPYWYLMSSQNNCKSNCQFKVMNPTVTEMKSELEKEIRSKTISCINNLGNLSKEYKLQPLGNATVSITLQNHKTKIDLDYPMEVKPYGRLSKFTKTYNLDLYHIISLAKDLMIMEATTGYFERKMLDIITLDSGINESMLPPMVGTTIGFDKFKIWTYPKVKSHLASDVSTYFQLFQVNGSDNYQPIHLNNRNVLLQKFYSHFTINPPRNSNYLSSLRNFDVNFQFVPYWNYYLKLDDGAYVIMPSTIFPKGLKLLSALIPLLFYDTTYDVSMPLLVRITQKNALDGKDYTFQYGLELNIRDNKPFNYSSSQVVHNVDLSSTNLNNPLLWNSGNYTIETSDAFGHPLSNVIVSEKIGNVVIPIGKTEMHNGVAKITTKLPPGYGTITARKINYISDSYKIVSSVNGGTIKLKLYPIIKKSLYFEFIKLIPNSANHCAVNTNSQNTVLEPGETIYLIMRRIAPSSETPVFNYVKLTNLSNHPYINLAPGNYSVYAFILSNKTVTIQKEDEQACLGPICVTVATIPSMKMNTTILGMLKRDPALNSYLEITPNELYNRMGSKVYMKLLTIDAPKTYDDLNKMSYLTECLNSSIRGGPFIDVEDIMRP